MKKHVYSEQDTPQVINERYLEAVKKFVKTELDKVPAEKQLEILIADDATFRIFTDFEIYYRIIFGSQISLLVSLYEANKFFSKHELEMFFMNQMQKRKIIIGVDIEFDKWLGFLVDQGLIAKKEETRLAAMLSSADYHITDKGVAFLTYISNRNYDKKDWGM
jgi:predicted transcriptional regulator